MLTAKKSKPATKIKAPAQQMEDRVQKQMERAVEIPPIEDVLAKAKKARSQALRQKQKQRQVRLQTWHCTECGGTGIQLYCDGYGHFNVALARGVPVDSRSRKKLTGRALTNFQCARKRGHVCNDYH